MNETQETTTGAADWGETIGAPSGQKNGALDFAGVFDLGTAPQMILDRDLCFVAVNRAYEAVTMRGREDLVGKNLFEMFPESSEAEQRLKLSIETAFSTAQPDTIALIPYEISRPLDRGGGRELRYWSASHIPILDAEGEAVYVIQTTNDVTDIARMKTSGPWKGQVATAELALWRNAENVESAYQQTLAENDEFHRLFSQAPGMIVVFEGSDLIATFVSDSFARFVGDRPMVARPLAEAIPELEGQDFAAVLREAIERGETTIREGMPIMLRRPSDNLEVVSLVDIFCNPVRDGDGVVYGVFVQGVDRTEAMRAAHHQRMLMDELNHRVKNTLATIQSMARQTFRNPVDLDAARYAFEARIMALSRVHNILAERRWEAVPLTALFCGRSQAVDPSRITYRGDEYLLSPRTGVALAIVIHELFANARQHGAFSRPDGEVQISWEFVRREGDRLALTWRETGLSLNESASGLRPGFGLRILRSIIEGELGGTVALDLPADGLICRFEVGISEVANVGP
ncbi:PAS domain-containing protein [Jiella endophytica]|uniref:Blue-light-activated histidine kinase n=1 Tax=Jiella endophytica TaxID=2558362 RepID=A0A4Y8RTR0_9HYPH|nr:PAS domain-containing sensor histidine kinase [Jiella endophytica]TFF27709.1 PAS domain-containing protein [Jiella endophytica]